MNEQQKQIHAWFQQQNWKYWSPLSQFTRLTEEVGELARVMNHLYGEKPKKDSEAHQHLESEIGDVLYTLACLANSEGLNLNQCLEKSINKVTSRDKNRF